MFIVSLATIAQEGNEMKEESSWDEDPLSVLPQQQNAWHPVTIRELSEQRHRFNIDPPFQRKQAWTRRQCQQLYETMLRGRPIGTLEGYKEAPLMEGGTTFSIIDGHQRITAILRFVDNKVKTWTHAQKLQVFPGSDRPAQGGKFFRNLDIAARNYILDYRIDINIIPRASEREMVERFLEIQCHTPLSPAERLYAYPSKAKDAAKRIATHQLWEQYYTGETNRGQVFQSSLSLLAVALSPDGFVDLRGQSVFMSNLASGKYDEEITSSLEKRVMRCLDEVCCIFAGMQFTDRIASVVMYQTVMRLQSYEYVISELDQGKLAVWMSTILSESKRTGTPVYNQPVQRLLYASSQRTFWERNLKTVLILFGISEQE